MRPRSLALAAAALPYLAGCPAPAPAPRRAPAAAEIAPAPPSKRAPPPATPAGSTPRALRVLARAGGAPLLADAQAKDVAFSPDGKLLASGGGLDGGTAVLLWDAATGTRAGALPGEGGRIERLAFSPDGRSLAATDLTASIYVWDLMTRRVIRRLWGHRASVYALAYAPGGRDLASLDGDGVVLLWDLSNPATKPRELARDAGAGTTIAFSRDGRAVAVPADRERLLLVPVAAGKPVVEVAAGAAIRSVAFARDGKTLLTGEALPGGAEAVSVRDAVTGARLRVLSGQAGRAGAVDATADGGLVVSGSGDGVVTAWDAATGQQRFAARTAGGTPVWSVAVSPDGARVAVAGGARAIEVRSLRDGASAFAQQEHAEHVSRIAYSPDGALLASADHAGRVLLRDAQTAVIRARLPDLGARLSSLAFAPDGSRLLTVARGDARFWDPRSGAPLGRLRVGRFDALVFTPDGRRLAASDDTRVVRLLDATTGAVTRTFGAAQPGDSARQNLLTPSSVAFTPGGDRMAVARWDQDVQVWDTVTGALVRTFPGLLHVAYAPDGRVLAAGVGRISKGGTELQVRLWDAATGRALRTIDAEPEARFSPRGDLLATLSEGEIDLWEVETGRLAARGVAAPHRPLCFAFSPDGRRVATGGGDASVLVWGVDATE